jgi:CDP-glycerol glycerophosphotransferase (TagB/SpsB family)
MLDVDRRGPLPGGARAEAAMKRWYLSPRRYVPSALERRLRLECGALVLANVQPHSVMPFLLGARRVGVPVVGYIASWDHTVGKGVITPHLDRYVVQNDVMRADLARFHGIGPERVVVTGWPQTDVFHQQRSADAYVALLRQYELDPTLPLVAIMGNTPTNAPYEGRFVERLVSWWKESSRGRFSLIVRPHPRDGTWRDRFLAALGVDGIHVQEASYTDLEALATLLQHVSAVVSNAGTILLDAIVNDCPSVCVLYDEGAPVGETWALENVAGEHYRELVQSEAFYRAHDFEEVTAGIERALARPSELADERARVAREVVGEVDGQAAERVVEAISAVL